MPRFAAIAFSGLALEIARGLLPEDASNRDAHLAVVVSRPGGAVQGETSLVGNTRLHEVSLEARALGVRPGQTLAAAKAKLSTLRVRVVPQAAVQAALVTVAETMLAFGATTSFEAGGSAGDIVWVDVAGCAHLHVNADDADGERTMAAAMVRAVLALGHACQVALADGATVAAAVARYVRGEVSIVPVHGNARAMGRLPLAALGLSDDAIGWLSKVGARKASDLQRLPRAALAARLGGEAPRVMALLDGDDRTPLRPHVPPEKPMERVVLEYGITHHEALFFVAKRLCDRIAMRLEGRVKKAAKLLLRLEVDHAVSGAPAKDPTLPITLASPLCKADELFAVVKAKIESPDGAARIAIEHEEDGTMDVPLLAVSLEVTEETVASMTTPNLFVPEARAERALPRLVAELSAELGPQAVGVLSVVDTWVTSERSLLVPYRTSASSAGAVLVSSGEEMSRLLPVPKSVSRSALTQVRLVARSEQVEWWRSGAAAQDEVVAFWEDRTLGKVGQGTAWVSIDGKTGDAFIRGWID
jgi:protein ImuB